MISDDMKQYNYNLTKWDSYFYDICKIVARGSSCLSKKIGAILVRDKSIISTGYNGPPRGVPHCDVRYTIDKKMRDYLESQNIDPDDINNKLICPRYLMGYKSGEGLEWCIAGHAERNTLINAARNGIKTKGCKVYMDCGVPCTPCLVELINAGIEEIVISKMEFYDTSAKYLLEQSTLKVRLYHHFCEHKNLLPKSILKNKEENFCSDCGMYMGI